MYKYQLIIRTKVLCSGRERGEGFQNLVTLSKSSWYIVCLPPIKSKTITISVVKTDEWESLQLQGKF